MSRGDKLGSRGDKSAKGGGVAVCRYRVDVMLVVMKRAEQEVRGVSKGVMAEKSAR